MTIAGHTVRLTLAALALCASVVPLCGCAREETAAPGRPVEEFEPRIVLRFEGGPVSKTVTDGSVLAADGVSVSAYRPGGTAQFENCRFTRSGDGSFRADRFWPVGIGSMDFHCVYPLGYALSRVGGTPRLSVGTQGSPFGCSDDLVTGSVLSAGREGVVPVTLGHVLCGLQAVQVRLSGAPLAGTSCTLDTLSLTVPSYATLSLPAGQQGLSWDIPLARRRLAYTGALALSSSDREVPSLSGRFLIPVSAYAMHLAWSWSGGARGAADIVLEGFAPGMMTTVSVTVPVEAEVEVGVTLSGYARSFDLGTMVF